MVSFFFMRSYNVLDCSLSIESCILYLLALKFCLHIKIHPRNLSISSTTMYIPSLLNIQLVFSIFANISWIGEDYHPVEHFPLSNTQDAHGFKFKPIVIWHGLGDNYNSSGIQNAVSLFQQIHPQSFVYNIYLDPNPSTDQQKSLFGDSIVELDFVCEQISQVPELQQGFDAVGFSQGGLFLRALAERCPSALVRTLVTFGSPHMGVMELPQCESPNDWLCRKKNELLRKQVWHDNIQKTVIPAQYFRDPYQYSSYLEHSHLLADINNERTVNSTYKNKVSALEKLVLIAFEDDTTVIPKESAWFYDINSVNGELIPFDKTTLYLNDFLGLESLSNENKIDFLSIPGRHMEIPETYLVDIARTYLGKRLIVRM